jgi:phosphoadenosine phosphosulfate reductase
MGSTTESSLSARDTLAARLAGASLFDVLRTGLELYGGDVRIACSLGVEDVVILHEAVRAGRELGVTPRVFLLDTGRLHQETYDLVDRIRDRYGLAIEAYAPDTVAVQDLVRNKGPNSFYDSIESRKECCHIRKIEPLQRALAGARAWVTGLRREQSPTRASVELVESDEANGGLLKLSPLANWTEREVWAFAEANAVPTHVLHRKGFPSIGCAPCTRAVQPGEDVRAGRWWWEDPQQKECGLHARAERSAQ